MAETKAGWWVSVTVAIRDKMPTRCYELSATPKSDFVALTLGNRAECVSNSPRDNNPRIEFPTMIEVMNQRDILCLYPLCSNTAWFTPIVFPVAKLEDPRVITDSTKGWCQMTPAFLRFYAEFCELFLMDPPLELSLL